MDKKYYKGADFSLISGAFYIIALSSFMFFIMTIIFFEPLSMLISFLWLAFLIFIFRRQRKRDKESYIHITDDKVSKVIAGKEQESISVDMIFDYYETPNRGTMTIVGKDATKTMTIEGFYFSNAKEDMVRSLAKLNIDENLLCDYSSINVFKEDTKGDSVYIANNSLDTIIFLILIVGSLYGAVAIHPTIYLIVAVIFLGTLVHFYSVHKIILTNSLLIEKSLLHTKTTKYQDIKIIEVEYVGGRGDNQKYPLVKINSIDSIGFKSDCEMNTKIYEDISIRLKKFKIE